MIWQLQYLREICRDEFEYYPVRQIITKTYDFKSKDLLKEYICRILSIELDNNKNPIEPTLEQVKKYNLFNNDVDKMDSILKFFKKNYERYLDIIKQSNDFENQDYTYDIVDQADYYYLDRLFKTDNEIFKKSFFKIIKKEED